MKYIHLCIAAFFTLFQVTACTDSDGVSPNNSSNSPDENLPGMVRLKIEKDSVLLGTNDGAAKANERPQITRRSRT